MPPTSSEVQRLSEANFALKDAIRQMEQANTDLEAEKQHLEQRIKLLQVTTTLSLAACGGVVAGAAASAARAAAPAVLGAGTAAFFAIVMAAMAILAFLRS